MTLRLFLGCFSTKCQVPAPKKLELFQTNSHVSRMEKRRLLTRGDGNTFQSQLSSGVEEHQPYPEIQVVSLRYLKDLR